MLPEGANAVMMVEYTEQIDDTTIEARRSISPWENVIISTGNEIIPAKEKPLIGQVRDINSYTLGACIEEAGGAPVYRGIIKDEIILLEQEIKKTIKEDKIEAVIISGGSSVGVRDITLEVLNRLGRPGVLIHGVSVKPGKPTILAITDNRPIFGLPGHPVSASGEIRINFYHDPGLRFNKDRIKYRRIRTG
jgi:molybdopterin molybdotransferase